MIASETQLKKVLIESNLFSSTIHGDYPLQPVTSYGLYITEEDGEVDQDFPCLDPRECVAKFGFTSLGLVEHKNNLNSSLFTSHSQTQIKNVTFEDLNPITEETEPSTSNSSKPIPPTSEDKENMALMRTHATAMEAPLYQCYKVFLLHKVRTRTNIQLGVSGEKLEIDPLGTSSLPWQRLAKPVSHHMDSVASCDLLETKSTGRAIFRLVYIPSGSDSNFKHYDFECEVSTAEEIVQKINLILELRSSAGRKEYIAHKDKRNSKLGGAKFASGFLFSRPF